ncbi:hypothetical protein GGX14DRAFT_676693 [Mycena pura]|uniref:Uncharacterized protein n=1 Tax=Mycena pura TaxID=153505 RepID=A0AAD6Y803_9AGAR|nr:hypothetical protein GGX14DRAFT_676693 [Mycena pura]
MSSLMRVLAHIADTPFVRPLTKTFDPDKFDGVATLLVCHIAEGSPKTCSSSGNMESEHSDSRTMESEHSDSRRMESEHSDMDSRRMESEHSDISLLPDYPMSVDNRSDTSSSEAPSIEVPLNAHILPGRGRHTYAVIPVLCVADRQNIVDLMTSVACQRHVWGISRPVVGFEISGVVARLVLSWVDPVTSIAHVACTSPKQAAPGFFDLTDASSALCFARFILNLAPDFSFISERAKAGCVNNRLVWRSDNVLFKDFGCWQDRVAQWIPHVEISSGTSVSLPAAASSDSASNDSSRPIEMAMSESTSTPQSKSGMKPKSSTQLSSSNSACSSIGELDIPYSFPAKSVTDLNLDESSNLTWMHDRFVERIGRIRFLGDAFSEEAMEEQREINQKIDLYDQMCGLRRMIDKSTLPTVDVVLSPVRAVLLAQLSELTECPVLSSIHQEFISGRLSALLSATVGAFTMSAKQNNVRIDEAESRHDWDALMYRFYNTNVDMVSSHVTLERPIHYPRNDVADQIGAALFIDNQLRRVLSTFGLCASATMSAGLDPMAAFYKQAVAASLQANELLTLFLDLEKKPGHLEDLVRTRSSDEPKEGTCDAILFMSFPNRSNLHQNVEIIKHAYTEKSSSPALSSPPPAGKMFIAKPPNLDRHSRTTKFFTKPEATAEFSSQSSPAKLSRLQDPFAVSSPEPAVLQESQAFTEILSSEGHLLLPHSTAEYNKHKDWQGKALNRGCFQLVSMVSYYSALDIADYPFYGLVTNGNVGAVLMAWKSTKQDKIYLMERNLQTFDISSPLQAFQFASFLLRLGDDQAELKRLVQAKLDAGVDVEKLARWRKLAQVEEVKVAAAFAAPPVPVAPLSQEVSQDVEKDVMTAEQIEESASKAAKILDADELKELLFHWSVVPLSVTGPSTAD